MQYNTHYYGFNANISSTFQAIKNLYTHITYLRFGRLCNIFCEFWVYLGINSFSWRISENYGIENFDNLIVLKLEFEVKNW